MEMKKNRNSFSDQNPFCRKAAKASLPAMWRKLLELSICMLTMLVLWSVPVLASGKSGVYDEVGMLSGNERAELDDYLKDLEQVYDVACVIYVADSTYGEEIRNCAAGFMQEQNIGAGKDDREALCLIHVPNEREYAVVVRGEAQYHFDTDIQGDMIEALKPYLADGEYDGAYWWFAETAERCLDRYRQGKSIRSMDVQGTTVLEVLLGKMVYSVPVGIFLAQLLAQMAKRQMKSIRPARGAVSYIPQNGVKISRQEDIFVRTEVRRTKRESDSKGSSGSFSHDGESFSGSSGKY